MRFASAEQFVAHIGVRSRTGRPQCVLDLPDLGLEVPRDVGKTVARVFLHMLPDARFSVAIKFDFLGHSFAKASSSFFVSSAC